MISVGIFNDSGFDHILKILLPNRHPGKLASEFRLPCLKRKMPLSHIKPEIREIFKEFSYFIVVDFPIAIFKVK